MRYRCRRRSLASESKYRCSECHGMRLRRIPRHRRILPEENPCRAGVNGGGSVSVRRANHVSVMRGADAHEIKAAEHPQSERGRPPRYTCRCAYVRIFGVPFVPGNTRTVSRGLFAGRSPTLAREFPVSRFAAPPPHPFPLLFFPLSLPPPSSLDVHPPARETERAIHLRSLAIAEQQRPCSDLARHVRSRSRIPRYDFARYLERKRKFNSI